MLSLIWLTLRTARGVEQRIPPVGKFIDLPTARLHVLDRGVAGEAIPPVLMLHGLGVSYIILLTISSMPSRSTREW